MPRLPGHEPPRSVGGRPLHRVACLWYGHRWDDPLCLHRADTGPASYTIWRCTRCDRIGEFKQEPKAPPGPPRPNPVVPERRPR